MQAYTNQLHERKQREQLANQDPNLAGVAFSLEQENFSELFNENESVHSSLAIKNKSPESAMIMDQDAP